MTQQEEDDYFEKLTDRNMPDCQRCKHSYREHLIPYTFTLRTYKASTKHSHSVDACEWTAGAFDLGCDCKGYKA